MSSGPRRPSAASPLKVAFYTDPKAWGGAEVYLSKLVSGVADLGHSPHVFCSDRRETDAWLDTLKARGFEVTRFRPVKEFDPRGFAEALRLLRGFEIVHFNKTHPRTCLSAIVAARLAGARAVVSTEHLAERPVSHYPFGRQILTVLIRITNCMLDRTIAVSELSRRMLLSHYGASPSKVVAIRNGVDLTELTGTFDTDAVRSELGLSPDDVVGVHVGAMIERKGHSVALRATPAILEAVPGFKLVFVGEGALEGRLRLEAETLGIDDTVVFAGFRRDVPALLAAAHLLMLPSDIECLPLVILEAMAAGLPVVASDVGGVSEAVQDSVTGFLISPRDAEGLARAVVRVLASPDGGASMGRAGRQKVEREFALKVTIAAVVDLYEKLVG